MSFLISSYRTLFARWASLLLKIIFSSRARILQYRIFSRAFVAFVALVKQTDIHAVEPQYNEPLTKVCETRLAQWLPQKKVFVLKFQALNTRPLLRWWRVHWQDRTFAVKLCNSFCETFAVKRPLTRPDLCCETLQFILGNFCGEVSSDKTADADATRQHVLCSHHVLTSSVRYKSTHLAKWNLFVKSLLLLRYLNCN